jgi:transposase InsO family protein
VIRHLHREAGYPIHLLCDVLNYPRSSYYYGPHGRDDSRLRATIREAQGRWPTYGYRRITEQLRREGTPVNRKQVRRLRRLMDLQAKIKAKKRRTTDSAHGFPRYPNLVQDLEVTHPDQVWVADITWIHLRREDVYLAVLMDVFTRNIRGWHLSRGLDHTLTCTALFRALRRHTPPAIHHSDQGVQYAASEYTDLLRQHGVQISMAEVGEAWQNGYAERLIRTIKEEEVDLSEYEDYHDALQQLGRFLDDVYMHKRIHSSLGYLTLIEFESQWLAQQAAANVV